MTRRAELDVPVEPADGGVIIDRHGRAWQRQQSSGWPTFQGVEDPHPPHWCPTMPRGNYVEPGPEYMQIPAAWPTLLALLGPVTVHWEGETE